MSLNMSAGGSCDTMVIDTQAGRSSGLRVPLLPSDPTPIQFRQWEPLALAHMNVKGVNPHLLSSPPILGSNANFIQLQRHIDSVDRTHQLESVARLLATTTLADSSSSSSSSSRTKKEHFSNATTDLEDNNKDLAVTRKLIAGSQQAYSLILTMLPHDLVAIATTDSTVVHGYAYSLWQWMQERYRHTAVDAIIELWQELTMANKTESKWSDYKARVDDLTNRIKAAGDDVPSGLYLSKLVYNLPDEYEPVVNALMQGGKLDDRNKVDWTHVRAAIEAHERQLIRKENNNTVIDNNMTASAFAVSAQSQCYNCKGYGHYASRCPTPPQHSRQSHRGRNHGENKNRNTHSTDEGAEQVHAALGKMDAGRGWSTGFSF